MILSDVHMPGQSGLRLPPDCETGDARVEGDSVRLSSPRPSGAKTERLAGMARGADGFILRPIEPQALVDEISRYTQREREPGA
jgi:CheY-like chemotaxis protein